MPLVITMGNLVRMEQVAALVAETRRSSARAAFSSEQIEAAEAARAEEGGFMRMVRRIGSLHIGDAVATSARDEQNR